MNRNEERMINQVIEEFRNKSGQFVLRRDDEAIAFITSKGNSTYEVSGTHEMNLNDAKKVLEDFLTFEKNPKVSISIPDETVLLKYESGNLEYFKNALPLDRKMFAEDTSEMIENLFQQKMIFEPVNEKITNVSYTIGGYTDKVDDFKGTIKGKRLEDGKVSTEEYSIEKDGETKGYFNSESHNSSKLSFAEAFTMSKELMGTENNKLLELDIEAKSDEMFEHITNIGNFGFEIKNCNESNLMELVEAAKVFQRTSEEYENIEIDGGPELGVKFAQELPNIWIDCNDESKIKYDEKKSEIYMGNTLHKLNSIEQMAEMLKTVSENCESNKNIKIQVEDEKLSKKNNSEWLVYETKKFHNEIKEELLAQKDFRPVLATDEAKEKIVCFAEGKLNKKDIETLEKDNKFSKITVIEGGKIAAEIKNENKNSKIENKKSNLVL